MGHGPGRQSALLFPSPKNLRKVSDLPTTPKNKEAWKSLQHSFLALGTCQFGQYLVGTHSAEPQISPGRVHKCWRHIARPRGHCEALRRALL